MKRETLRQPATVNRELAALSKIFTLAADAGVATSNPCLRVKKLRQDNSRTRHLLSEEEARLMAALESRPLLCSVVVEAKRRAVESIAEAGNVCLKFVTSEHSTAWKALSLPTFSEKALECRDGC